MADVRLTPLSNYEVDQYLKNVPGFVQTKARDMFKSKIKKLACGVVNLDKSTGPGTHFTCYYNHPDNEFVYYYDSYGVVPPTSIEEHLKSTGRTIAYNTSQHQKIESVLCGYFCIYVITELARGKTFNDVMLSFSDDPEENEEMMIQLFNLR